MPIEHPSGEPMGTIHKLLETFPLQQRLLGILLPKKRYIMLFCSSEGRKCSKYGVHQGMCVYICRFTKVTGNVLSVCVFNVLSMPNSKDMF